MTPVTLRARAFAKINLVLRVGARQADGYHPIETVFQSLALHDVLSCRVRRGPFGIDCDDASVPCDDRNLVWRAARALWHRLGRAGEPAGCAITITKHIPLAAGLGGGSADAAAALALLNLAWKARLSAADLGAVGASIGADVPYFFVGGTALGLGRGDDVYPLADLAPAWVVLACPPFGVSTADAYRWLDEARARGEAVTAAPATMAAWGARVLTLRNDLEGPVGARHGVIPALVEQLAASGARGAAMTGSGSTVFGLFGDAEAARRAGRAAAAAGAQAIITRTTGRAWCRRQSIPD